MKGPDRSLPTCTVVGQVQHVARFVPAAMDLQQAQTPVDPPPGMPHTILYSSLRSRSSFLRFEGLAFLPLGRLKTRKLSSFFMQST